jgi:hypothetical protein
MFPRMCPIGIHDFRIKITIASSRPKCFLRSAGSFNPSHEEMLSLLRDVWLSICFSLNVKWFSLMNEKSEIERFAIERFDKQEKNRPN